MPTSGIMFVLMTEAEKVVSGRYNIRIAKSYKEIDFNNYDYFLCGTVNTNFGIKIISRHIPLKMPPSNSFMIGTVPKMYHH